MRHWPDKEEALLNEFLDHLGYPFARRTELTQSMSLVTHQRFDKRTTGDGEGLQHELPAQSIPSRFRTLLRSTQLR